MGLSGSNKLTIENEFANELHACGIGTFILDGNNVWHGLNKDLGFTDADRVAISAASPKLQNWW